MKRKLRMRKMLREDDLEELIKQVKDEEPAAETESAPKAETPADKVLALQKSAGNSAVGAVLERYAAPHTQRARKLPTWPESPVMLLGGEDALPIESVQDASRQQPTGIGSGTAERDKDPNGPGELVVTMLHGKHTGGLHQAVVEGRHYAKVELVIPGKGGGGMRWILSDVYVAGGDISRDVQTIRLSYARRELAHSPPAAR